MRKYRHNDLEDLERLLARDADKPGGRMIVTDGVFSMSGHIADLPGIVELARRYGARVVVDDAHATGVLGETGRGTPEHFGLEDEVDLIIGTFSKSFASVGGFVAGPRRVINYIKHHGRPFIFTAALPAMQVAVALEALEIMDTEPEHRERLTRNAEQLREGIGALGFDTLGSETQIVPVLIGPDELTVMFWKGLWEEGHLHDPRPSPRRAPGAEHHPHQRQRQPHPEQMGRLLEAFATVGRGLGVIG